MVNLRGTLESSVTQAFGADAATILAYLPDRAIDPQAIRAVMINEVVAGTPENDFYSVSPSSAYMETTLPLFHKAGVQVSGIWDIVRLGVYITNAVKLPKAETTISTETIGRFAPLLAEELDLFPNLQAIMLMGDVAKKAFNMIAKARTGKNAVPSTPTYRLRHCETYFGAIRIFPAYIMTGKNILIEKSKVEMSAEDIGRMLTLLR